MLYSVFNEHRAVPGPNQPEFARTHHPIHQAYCAIGVWSISFSLYVPECGCRHCRLVGLDGLEPSTSRLSGARSSHLSYRPLSASGVKVLVILVEMMGIEPMTPCLQGRCSPSWATPPKGLFFSKTCLKVSENWTTLASSTYRKYLAFRRLVFIPTYDTTYSWQYVRVSIERRWSSRTFRYGYLVTT